MKKKKNYYYDISEDLSQYPLAVILTIIGGRSTGKTYSALKYCKENNKKFVFVKRTIDDVKMICAGSQSINQKGQLENKVDFDISPFKPLNRDLGWNIKAFSIPNVQGMGGFWDCDIDGLPTGQPIGYVVGLNAVHKIKGFDMSECDFIIFDEFVPQKYERVNRDEHIQLLDLYRTVSRDREHRGKEPLKLIMLANAVSISNPIMNGFKLTDVVANMNVHKQEYNYMKDRRILVHMIEDNPDFYEKESASAIYTAMSDTDWANMSLNNEFAYDDFTNIKKGNLKGYKCVCHVKYNKTDFYIYKKQSLYIVTQSRGITKTNYDLDLENDQSTFYLDWVFKLADATIHNRCIYSDFSAYDLIVRYKKVIKPN